MNAPTYPYANNPLAILTLLIQIFQSFSQRVQYQVNAWCIVVDFFYYWILFGNSVYAAFDLIKILILQTFDASFVENIWEETCTFPQIHSEYLGPLKLTAHRRVWLRLLMHFAFCIFLAYWFSKMKFWSRIMIILFGMSDFLWVKKQKLTVIFSGSSIQLIGLYMCRLLWPIAIVYGEITCHHSTKRLDCL